MCGWTVWTASRRRARSSPPIPRSPSSSTRRTASAGSWPKGSTAAPAGTCSRTRRPDDIVRAVKRVAEGGAYVDPTLASELVAPKATERLPALSGREREILGLLANGYSNPEIAQRLFISPETVRTHVRNAMTKLEADTRTQAVALALRYEFID